MKVELSNQELIDIYSCIGAVILNNSEIMEREILGNKFRERLEEENRRLMELTPKVFKLIEWGNN
nr:hypothetical protein [uncultured Cellulosilyticum sp.]